MGIKDMQEQERPREKLIKHGPKTPTDSELLAIILSTGSKKENVLSLSRNLLKKYNLKSLSKHNITKLKKQLGIGDVKACQIVACFELGRRLSSFNELKKPQIISSKDVAKLFLPEMQILEQEHFKCIYLDTKQRIIKNQTIFIGSLNESVIHPREIFKIAIEESAAAIILLHNHPSGDPSPSSSDIKITKELIQAGDLLGIKVLDHIIIGGKKYISLRERLNL